MSDVHAPVLPSVYATDCAWWRLRKINYTYYFYLVIEAPDHVYVLGKTYTCHTDLSAKILPPPARISSGCNDVTRRVLPEFQRAEPGLRHIQVNI